MGLAVGMIAISVFDRGLTRRDRSDICRVMEFGGMLAKVSDGVGLALLSVFDLAWCV